MLPLLFSIITHTCKDIYCIFYYYLLIIDLLVEFITSHMMKKFPLELYHHCIGVLQRLLCYQKRCRVRLGYQWRDLWTALINLLKFLTTHESHLIKKMNIFPLAIQVMR